MIGFIIGKKKTNLSERRKVLKLTSNGLNTNKGHVMRKKYSVENMFKMISVMQSDALSS